jgi:predicted transcriptional regulator YdeE
MDSVDFGGRRKYIADFEVYDDRAVDPENAAVDIYIGIDF